MSWEQFLDEEPVFDEDEELEDEEEPELQIVEMPTASTPTLYMEDDEVEGTAFDYSTRAPEDWVSSGPLGRLDGRPGRYFETIEDATAWARKFFGKRLKGVVPEAQHEGSNRWAFLIRGPRGG